VLLENVSASLEVAIVLDRFDDIEMITPAGDLEPVVAPAPGKPADLLEGEIGPLSGEQRNRSRLSWVGLASRFLQTGVTRHRILLEA
jgi:hypothetical protein